MFALAIASAVLAQTSSGQAELVTYFARAVSDSRSIQGTKAEYGLTQQEFDSVTARVFQRMIAEEFDHNPNLSLKERAATIRSAVLKELGSRASGEDSVLVQRMVCQGLYEWVRTHFKYSQYLAKDGLPREVIKPFWDPATVLKLPNPYCVCAGYANTMVELGKSLGLDVFAVNGFARRWFDSSKLPQDGTKTWHKWVVLRQTDGLLIPFDPTTASIGLSFARNTPAASASARCTAPSSPEDWAIFNAVYYATLKSGKGPIERRDQVNSLSYETWKQVDISNLRSKYAAFTGTANWKTCLTD